VSDSYIPQNLLRTLLSRNQTTIGDLLNRAEYDWRNDAWDGPEPFDRAKLQAAILARFPEMSPAHPNNPSRRQYSGRAEHAVMAARRTVANRHGFDDEAAMPEDMRRQAFKPAEPFPAPPPVLQKEG
jgi:hypothetical protein